MSPLVVMTNRGTAYILFESINDAESAIAHMHEAQLDGASINVSIVLPRRHFSQSPPPSRKVRDAMDRYDRQMATRRDDFGRGPPTYDRTGRPGRSPPPPRRSGYGGRSDRGRDLDTYRPRSYTRSRSPRRSYSPRSKSISSRSYSRSPPPRRRSGAGGGHRRRDGPPPPPPQRGEGGARGGGGGGGGGRRRRSPSYSSYGSYNSRSRSRSRSLDRGGRRR